MKKMPIWRIVCVSMLALTFTSPVFATDTPTEKVLITFKQDVNHALLDRMNVEIDKEYSSVPVVAATVPANTIYLLQANSSIYQIEKDVPVYLSTEYTDYGMDMVDAPRAWSSNYTGKQIKIGIIDTGIDSKHEDLVVAGGASFVKEFNGDTSYNDLNGHGTHIAGIIGAKHNDLGVRGLAPDSKLYAIKAFTASGQTEISSIIEAIDWGIQNKMDILNLSFGSDDTTTAMETILKKAEAANILLVGAAGNSGVADSKKDTMEYPAKYPTVISVGAVDEKQNRANFNDQGQAGSGVEAWSATGSTLDVVAPGHRIASTYANNTYAEASGTSMATPYVVGLLALYKEAYPTLDAKTLRAFLINNTIDLGPKGKDVEYGYGLVQFPPKEAKPPVAKVEASNLKAVQKNQQVSLTWTAPTSSYQKVTLYKNGTKVTEGKNTSYTDSSIQANTTYTYNLTTTDTAGNESVGISVTITTTKASSGFSDVPSNHWAAENIRFVAEQKWMRGVGATTTFKPEKTLTRAEAAVIFVRMLKLTEKTPAKVTFNDVPKTHWAFSDIAVAVQHGIFSGTGNIRFSPNDAITRREMAVVLHRSLAKSTKPPLTVVPFRDVPTRDWGYDSIYAMAKQGIIGGYANGQFKPNQPVTRAESAALFTRSASSLPKK